jgi:hypothetical protein
LKALGIFCVIYFIFVTGTSSNEYKINELPIRLPTPRGAASAACDGDGNIYILGGALSNSTRQFTDEILKLTTSTNSIDIVGKFPKHEPSNSLKVETIAYGSAIWDGAGNIYHFGGTHCCGVHSKIWKFTISTGNIENGGALANAAYGTSAVWDGANNAYIFGGVTGGNVIIKSIQKFTLSTKSTIITAQLPTPRRKSGAIWDGTGNAYIFGGCNNVYLDEIVKYTPSTGLVTVLPITLPFAMCNVNAAWDGTHVYIIGDKSDAYADLIVQFTPSTSTITTLPITLPFGLSSTNAVWVSNPNQIYILGGSKNISNTLDVTDDILTIDLTANPACKLSSPPQLVVAFKDLSQNESTEITISWDKPYDDGGSQITSYRVYRNVGIGWSIIAEVCSTTLTYIDESLPETSTRHLYSVSAVNCAGESPKSNIAQPEFYYVLVKKFL